MDFLFLLAMSAAPWYNGLKMIGSDNMYYTKEHFSSLAPKIRMPEKAFKAVMAHFDAIQEVLYRIFGPAKESLDEYEPTSSLAHGVLSYLKSGKLLGSGMGYTRY